VPSPIRAEQRDPTERVVEDDQGAHRAAEFQEQSLLNQRLRALRMQPAQPGICSNCDCACLPRAVYCDQACRDDHEARMRQVENGGRR
jgi:hypothetical protein